MKILNKIRVMRTDTRQPEANKGNASFAGSALGGVLVSNNNNRKSIFRGKASGFQRTASIAIPQSVTWTMSEEESMSSTKIPCASMDELHQPELVAEELNEMHQEELAEKDWEIAQIKSSLEEKLTRMKMFIEELNEAHQDELAEKDEDIAEIRASLEEAERELAHTIVNLNRKEGMLDDSEVALLEAEMKLDETKHQLGVVSRSLMVHQHKLHDKEEELKTLKSFLDIGKGVLTGFFSAF